MSFRSYLSRVGCLVAAAVVLCANGAAAEVPTGLIPVPGTVLAPTTGTADVPPKTEQTCGNVMEKLADLRAQGVSKAVCLGAPVLGGSDADSASSPQAEGAAAAAAANPQPECTEDNKYNIWYYSRLWTCIVELPVQINTINTQTGAIIGTAVYRIEHSATFNAYSGSWNNFALLYSASQTGTPSNIVKSVSRCNQCFGGVDNATPIPTQTMAPFGTASGTNTLADTPVSTFYTDPVEVEWADTFTCSGCTTSVTLTYTFPKTVRCDSRPNVNGYTGCVIPAIVPQLLVPGYASGNTAAYFINKIQGNVDHWGKYPNGAPLTRLADKVQRDANRDAMCKGFVKNPAISDDSCDEFPLAATYQSGNMQGLAPSACSEITARWVSGKWVEVPNPKNSTTQHCGLGHVPLPENTAVGTLYSNLIGANRLIDQDPFWLAVLN